MLLGWCWLGLAGLARGADSPGAVVVLPPMVVADSVRLPKPESWRYGRMADFEVLSNAPDATSRRIVRDLLEFRQAAFVVWPSLQPRSAARDRLIALKASLAN